MPATSKAQLAWAAGLFEGEGSFSATDYKYGNRIMARLSSTDEDVVRVFHGIVGCGYVYGPLMHGKRAVKPAWTWQATSFEHVQAIVAMFWEFLGLRRKERARQVMLRGKQMKWSSPKCNQGRKGKRLCPQ